MPSIILISRLKCYVLFASLLFQCEIAILQHFPNIHANLYLLILYAALANANTNANANGEQILRLTTKSSAYNPCFKDITKSCLNIRL